MYMKGRGELMIACEDGRLGGACGELGRTRDGLRCGYEHGCDDVNNEKQQHIAVWRKLQYTLRNGGEIVGLGGIVGFGWRRHC